MPEIKLGKLANADNAAILDRLHAESSLEYQRRVPLASQAGAERVLDSLTDFRPNWNEFESALVNRIGSVIGRTASWSNPLAIFKRGLMVFGDSVEEYMVGLLKAHTYDPKREYMEEAIFGTERPPVDSQFHKVNRQEYYRLSVNPDLLQRAFVDPNGLSKFVTDLMQSPTTSDQWDEFTQFVALIPLFEANGGFWHVNVPDVSAPTSNMEDAKSALRIIRTVTENMRFLNTKYNAAKMPVAADADKLVLITTPEFKAAIDVEALATLFNLEKAKLPERIVTIPADMWGIDGCQAIMTTEDFFVILDKVIENTSQFNPVKLQTNYFFHHWQVISASRFVPAVMFTTKPGDDVVVVVTPKITAISTVTFKDTDGETVTAFKRGLTYEATPVVTLTPPDPDGKYNVAMRFEIRGNSSTKTTITDTGVVRISGTEEATSINIVVHAGNVDPANPEAPRISKTVTVNITGDVVPEWGHDLVPSK